MKLNLILVIKLFVKVLCFVVLLRSAALITKDYLSFPIVYNLMVTDNRDGTDLPAISVCTDRHVLFDKLELIKYLGLKQKYLEHKEKYKKLFGGRKLIVKCNSLRGLENRKCVQEFILYVKEQKEFSKQYEPFIYDDLSLEEFKTITISEELFQCEANVRLRSDATNDSNHVITDGFKRFAVLRSVYANNDFGICFTFFDQNYSIYLKDKDFLKLTVDKYYQNKFLYLPFFDMTLRGYAEKINFKYEKLKFSLKMWIKPTTRQSHDHDQLFVYMKEQGFNSEIRFRKTSLDLLSTPYDKYCFNYGKYYSLKLRLLF